MKTLVAEVASLVIASAAVASVVACSPGSSSSSSAGNSITGNAAMSFTPTFIGSATIQGTCPCPSGDQPSSYQGIVILMSDDPTLEAQCNSTASVTTDVSQYHYVTVQVLSANAVTPASYPITSTLVTSTPFATVVETYPNKGNSSVQENFIQDDDPNGTVEIDELSNVVKGSFNAQSLHIFGSQVDGNLTGAFEAPACQAPVSGMVDSPCAGCPG